MPTIVRDGVFEVKIFGPPREHPPAHVHVYKRRQAAVVIRLGTDEIPATIWHVFDMKPADVAVAFRLVLRYEHALRRAWEEIHG